MKKPILIAASVIAAGTLCAEPTIWIIGDSTVANYGKSRYPQNGWGQQLDFYCKPNVKVDNRAVGGRSTKSFIDEKRWDKMLPVMKKGDFLFIQFGHNDMKKNKPKVYAPADSLYQELLKKFIKEAKAKGTSTILVTSVCRRVYKNGKLLRTLKQYPDAMRKVAKETGTPLIDLNNISREKFTALGEEGTKKVFLHLPKGKYKRYPDGKEDNSHFQESGARLIAGWIVENAKKQNLAVAKLFK